MDVGLVVAISDGVALGVGLGAEVVPAEEEPVPADEHAAAIIATISSVPGRDDVRI
jgi:hypothetical protein